MSNARSPRDVCSTTMGTKGLIGWLSFPPGAVFLPQGVIARRLPNWIRL